MKPVNNRKTWTREEDETFKKLVEEKTRLKDIAKILQRTHKSCGHRLEFLKLTSRIIPNKTRTVDESFWSVPNPINCYYAGYLAADGYILLSKSKKEKFKYAGRIAWTTASIDKHVLEKFKELTKFDGPISYDEKKNAYSITINCRKWNEDLVNNFNMIENKTYRVEPPKNLTEQQMFCWIIGYIDGDGTVHCRKNRKNAMSLSFLSCSPVLIDTLYSFLMDRFPQRLTSKKRAVPRKATNSNCWAAFFTGIKALCIISYLRQYNVPKLARKWEKPELQEIENFFRSRSPESFDFSYLPDPV